jgi:hypothetical protein
MPGVAGVELGFVAVGVQPQGDVPRLMGLGSRAANARTDHTPWKPALAKSLGVPHMAGVPFLTPTELQ